nr:hypothetical protein [uncultured Sphingomonas sp.]
MLALLDRLLLKAWDAVMHRPLPYRPEDAWRPENRCDTCGEEPREQDGKNCGRCQGDWMTW